MKKKSSRPASKRAATSAKQPRKPARRPTNLTLDPEAVARGERFSKRQGTSLSSVVTQLLYSLPDDEPAVVSESLSPAVRRLYGIANGAELCREAYRDHLMDKYGRDR